MTNAERPWSATIRLDEIAETGRHVEFEASEEVRAALAKPAGVDAIERLVARFDLTRRGRDRLHVSGEVSGTVRQTCVVTLDPVTNEINPTIDVDFAPPEKAMAGRPKSEDESPSSIEGPEPLVGDSIDLGALATEYLILGVDPYPRKADAVFEPLVEAPDPEDHPFAALKALKVAPKKSGAKKPKGK